MLWSLWLMSAVILFVIEILTPGAFFFACLGFGALVAALAAFLNVPNGLPWIVFIGASLVSIYTIRPLARKFFQGRQYRSNVDALIGRKAWVVEAIEPPDTGMVKVEGELWRAESREAQPAGVYVTIVGIQGTRLEVARQEGKQEA